MESILQVPSFGKLPMFWGHKEKFDGLPKACAGDYNEKLPQIAQNTNKIPQTRNSNRKA